MISSFHFKIFHPTEIFRFCSAEILQCTEISLQDKVFLSSELFVHVNVSTLTVLTTDCISCSPSSWLISINIWGVAQKQICGLILFPFHTQKIDWVLLYHMPKWKRRYHVLSRSSYRTRYLVKPVCEAKNMMSHKRFFFVGIIVLVKRQFPVYKAYFLIIV